MDIAANREPAQSPLVDAKRVWVRLAVIFLLLWATHWLVPWLHPFGHNFFWNMAFGALVFWIVVRSVLPRANQAPTRTF
jgi:hypothetical protein